MSNIPVRSAEDLYIYRFDSRVYTLEDDPTSFVAYFNTMAEAEIRGRAMAHAAGVSLWRVNSSGSLTLVASFRPE